MNLRDFVYPEYPIHQKEAMEEKIPNVWKPWLDDSPSKIEKIFDNERKSMEFNYDRLLRRVVRDEEQMTACMKLLKENLEKILLY